ncbi:ATP-dependent DNA helicase RecG [Nocardioides marinquilinus]|uniref:Probable DNA 3'-5' helicase RecG n=1 Tax=Nocardioides marinquilinus TaxID=1210400 RepID=A0ABP9PXJ2_9ACTN
MAITVDTPVAAVLGRAGGRGAKKHDKIRDKLGLHTVGDLLRHFPRRYIDTTNPTAVDELHEGQLLTVVGTIASCEMKSWQDKRRQRTAYRVETLLQTDGPSLTMTFFAANRGMAESFRSRFARGRTGIFVGTASRFREHWQLTNPKAVMLGANDADTDTDRAEAAGIGPLFPVYPLTAGVESWDLQRAVTLARDVVDAVPDVIPDAVRERYGLVGAEEALQGVHAPAHLGEVARAHRHFRFEEALVTQLVLARRRRAAQARAAQTRDGGDGRLLAAFDDRMPFTLTAGQTEVGETIAADLGRPHPMNRLLQGEVGSGKTLVALRAMLHVVDSGGQAALLAPTEVLAQQHHRSIVALLGELAQGGMLGGTTVELLTGSMTKTQRTGPMSRLGSGEAGIVVGTHALLEEKVQFADLGLVVVDEQHRFGVEQRAALTDKSGARGTTPHVLVMTATPIPRTVAMTVFGDLEVSTLRELPAGRAAIQSNVVDLVDHPGWVTRVWARVREEVEAGHQVYVVCPRITGDELEQGESDAPETVDEEGQPVLLDVAGRPPLAAVEDVAAELADGPLAGLRLAVLHGRLAPEVKEATMRAFADGEVDVLVATTVIEVGVDVHNATTMVVLDADRFGVSQLHQLRGRVGRGGLPGLCLLVSHAGAASDAGERLAAVASTTDGFELSRVDLEHRREGDVLGRTQSGRRSSLQNLRVLRDEQTIVEAREAADALLDDDPDLTAAPLLAAAVTELETSATADFIERS